VTAAVTPLRDADGRVIGLIAHCGVKDLPHTPDEISTLCEQRLPRHLWPGCVVLHRRLPRTSGGKVDYEALDRALSAPAAAFN
jgi:acyl-CoA synthetase (AMP-forming)/AMP-acid ligase II